MSHLSNTSTKKSRFGWLVWTSLIGFAVTRAYLLVGFTPFPSKDDSWFSFAPKGPDIQMYFAYAVASVDAGKTPYVIDPDNPARNFEIEYPPLAFWTIAFPRWRDGERLTPREIDKMRRGDYGTLVDYWKGFRWQMEVFDLAAFLLFLFAVRRRRPECAAIACWAYVIGTAMMGNLLFDRLDVGLLFFLMLWAFFWVRSLGLTRQADGWILAAYFAFGLGISYKLIPVVALPFLLLAELQFVLAAGRARRLPQAISAVFGRVAVFAIAVSFPFFPHFLSVGTDVFAFLKYHGERELEIESSWATLLMFLNKVGGLGIETGHAHKSFYVDTTAVEFGSFLQSISTIVLFGIFAAVGLWAVAEGRRYDRVRAFWMACFAICMLVILARVFSTQYWIWIIPLLLLLGAEVLSRWRYVLLAVLLILMAGMTTWVFPYNFYSHELPELTKLTNPNGLVPALSDPACWMMIARNAIYLGTIVWLGVAILRASSTAPVLADEATAKRHRGNRSK